VRLKLSLELAKGEIIPKAELPEELKWFLEATHDEEKRKMIFGGTSMKKLHELQDGKTWVKWLYDQFVEADTAAKEFMKEELKRPGYTHDSKGKFEKKWKIKIKLETPSHSIRPNAVVDWNKHSDFLKLYPTAKKDGFIAEIIVPKSVALTELWAAGMRFSELITLSLCISTGGIFWWHVDKDPDRFYEEITDLENGSGVVVAMSPRLSVAWRDAHLVVKKEGMNQVAYVFSYLSRIPKESSGPFADYLIGLAMFSKTDIHLRLERNALAIFFSAFKGFLVANQDWDGKEPIADTALRLLGECLTKPEELNDVIQKSLDSLANPDKPIVVTLTDVLAMKLYCDMYLRQVISKASKPHSSSNNGKAK
jgi:hypothetical protein